MELPAALGRPLAYVAREYVLRFPVARGKGVVVRHVTPLLPARFREFDADLPGGGVVAIEADEDYVPRLRANLARNGVENVTVVAAAAGASDGEVELTLAADRAFSSIKPLVSYRGAGMSRTVPLRRLDTIWSEADEPAVAFVKIDVEGAELEVIAGAERLLER